MTITFRCESCHKEVNAPDNAAGKRGKCPYCKQSTYIPTPISDEDVLPLAPLDEDDERKRQEELRRLRQKEREILAAEKDEGPSEPLDQRDDVSPEDLYHMVVNYCLDMAGGKLGRSDTHVKGLQKFKAAGIAAVEDFISGKVAEPALSDIPGPVLKGFLRQLREQL